MWRASSAIALTCMLGCAGNPVEGHAARSTEGEASSQGEQQSSSESGMASTTGAAMSGEASSGSSEGGREEGSTSFDGSSGSDSDSTAQAPSCDDKYGRAPGYVLCWETATTCAFNAHTGGSTCNVLCATFGGVCEDAHDNPNGPGEECDILQPDDDCNTMRSTEICECSK